MFGSRVILPIMPVIIHKTSFYYYIYVCKVAILWMEKILHHLGWLKPFKYQLMKHRQPSSTS
jgi:hypothetical protein